MPPSVAAVCDRRKSTAPAETSKNKPVRCSSDLRPPEESELALIVAAVCDRRMENETGSHSQSLQWAVYDRRRLLSILCLLFFLSSFSLSASQQKQTPPPVDPTVVYDTTVKVLRGGTCEVPLRAISPQGYDAKFEILSGPRGGSLSGPQRNSKSSVSYFYTHDGKKNSSHDSFRFKSKSGPQKAWGYAQVTILVEEPQPRFAADMSSLDFGSVFLGESRSLPILIKNSGGGKLEGRLKVGEPWRIADSADLKLTEGESKKILIIFEPNSTDTQQGNLVFESGTKPFPKIALQGVGESRFELTEAAAFPQFVGANELRIPVKNRTAEPLPISIVCQPPIEASDSITLAPESSGELVLTLPARHFAEKSALVALGDGAATREIRVQLPPAPSQLRWENVGKNQLGVKSAGRVEQLTAKLLNTGSVTASVVLRTEGGAFSLASGQPLNLAISAGESVTVNATWKLPDTPGLAEAALIAETAGLPPFQTSWEADIQRPLTTLAATPTPTPNPHAAPTPTLPTVLTEEEKKSLRKRMPRDFYYRLKPELHWAAFFPTRRTAVATIFWSYEGPEPVEFIIQREVNERKGFFDKNPFDRILPTPDDLAPQSLQPVWSTLNPADAKIQKLPDGRWRAQVPALLPGYHKIRIIAKQPDAIRMDGADFSLLVSDIPLPQPLPWTLPAFLALCATYLFRKKIRSLFG